MNRVPLDERRRLFLARQQASQALRDQLPQPVSAHVLSTRAPSHRHVQLVVKAVMIAVLLGAGVVALHTVSFNLPTSVVEALLPRF